MVDKKNIKVNRKKLVQEYLKTKKDKVLSFGIEQPYVSSWDYVYYMMKYKSKD
jgi:hypothetical protein